MAPPPLFMIRPIVQAALEEDIGAGDLTSQALIPNGQSIQAHIIAKEPMVVAGLAVAQEVFHLIDKSLTLQLHHHDGANVRTNTKILTIKGNASSILQAERVALNFMQRLSGISTLTHQFCQAVKGLPVKIVDTRKTTPGLRILEKWAVRLGGGYNHRNSLHDGILIKDNHLLVLANKKISLSQACRRAREQAPHGLRICVEAENLAQVRQALQGEADSILLDNMPPSKIEQAVTLIKSKAIIEVSGGINLQNIRSYALPGVDIISIGALTHSARAMDLSLDMKPQTTQQNRRRR